MSNLLRETHPPTQSSIPIIPLDPFTTLPVELLYDILDLVQLDENHPSTLRALSCSNRFLSEITRPLLWRKFKISDQGLESPDSLEDYTQWGKRIRERTSVLISNPQRRAYVRDLEIILSGSRTLWRLHGASVVRYLTDALLVLPSLHRLKLRTLHKDPQHIVPRLAAILTNSKMPFVLREFECSASLEPALFPFLRSQKCIERYSTLMDPGYIWYEGKAVQATRAAEYKSILPSLKSYSGPPNYAHAMCIVRDLESLEVHSRHADYDLERLRAPVVLRAKGNVTAKVSSVSLVYHPHRNFPTFIGAHIAELISVGYSISVASVQHLRFVPSFGFYDPPSKTFFPSVFTEFQQLKSIEWAWSLPFPLLKAKNVRWNGWTRGFVRDCESSCPTLKRISLLSGERRTIEFVRIQEPRDGEGGGRSGYSPTATNNPKEGRRNVSDGQVVMTLETGSVWTAITDFPLILGHDLSRDI